jgi:hypothetical protein
MLDSKPDDDCSTDPDQNKRMQRTCPFCGEIVGLLPDHLPCDEVQR